MFRSPLFSITECAGALAQDQSLSTGRGRLAMWSVDLPHNGSRRDRHLIGFIAGKRSVEFASSKRPVVTAVDDPNATISFLQSGRSAKRDFCATEFYKAAIGDLKHPAISPCSQARKSS